MNYKELYKKKLLKAKNNRKKDIYNNQISKFRILHLQINMKTILEIPIFNYSNYSYLVNLKNHQKLNEFKFISD